jgi:riboflavin transporter FmnP
VLAITLVAYGFEKAAKRRSGDKDRVLATRKIVMIGMFGAISGILYCFDFALPIAPNFYKLDFSELPALIAGFAFGPVAGVLVEFVKQVVKLMLKSTSTAFVGDLANYLIGCMLVLPASVIYQFNKSKQSALIGCAVGTIVMTVFGTWFNAVYLLPTFAINGGLQSFASSTRNYYAFEDTVFPALKDFDFLIFDTSPAFGDFEKGIANCADVIVPVLKLDQFSADGFQTLIENLITTTKEIRCKDLLEKISFVILNQQDKRMKFQSLFAENFMKNFDDTQFLTIPTDTSFVKAQILKNSIQDKAITARKETTDAIGSIIKEMTK